MSLTDHQTIRPLILVFGMPRSGTTWLGKILDSHPDTLYRHEPDAGGTLDHVPWVAEKQQAELVGDALRAFVAGLPAMNSPKVAGSTPLFPKRYCSPGRLIHHKASLWAAKIGERLMARVPVPCLASTSSLPDVTVVWKSVESLTRLGALVRAVQPCRVVVLLRHPCGQIASVMRGEGAGRFQHHYRAAEDYGIFHHLLQTHSSRRHELTLDRLRAAHPVERLAWKWVLANETAIDGVRDVDGCTVIRYEEICANPTRGARELLDTCGLEWTEQTAEFVSQSTSEDRKRYYSVFKNPVRSANRWRAEMPPEHVELIYGVVRNSRLVDLYPE
jgi:hypothetical protein